MSIRSAGTLGAGAVALLVTAAACWGGPRLADPWAEPGALRRTPVIFTEFRGKPFEHPLVRAVVAGTPTLMLLDTGASHHVLARGFAERAGVRTGDFRSAGRDHAGERLQVSRVELADLRLEGWGRVATHSVLAVELPELFERMGIGGILSPQLLQEGPSRIELSFRDRELRLLPASSAPTSDPVRASFRSHGQADLCWAQPRDRKATKYLVRVLADGHPARLEVDTGSTRTNLRATSRAGSSIAGSGPNAPSQLVSAGGAFRAERTRASLAIGDLRRTLEIDLVPGVERPGCPADGVVGMDVLRGCALLFDHTGLVARCETATAGGARSGEAQRAPSHG